MSEDFAIRLKEDRDHLITGIVDECEYAFIRKINPLEIYTHAYPKSLWEKVPIEKDIMHKVEVSDDGRYLIYLSSIIGGYPIARMDIDDHFACMHDGYHFKFKIDNGQLRVIRIEPQEDT